MNLVGSSAVDSCLAVVNFFVIIQLIYSFFAVSTKRWDRLESLVVAPKSLPETRWEAHYKSVVNVLTIFDVFREILDEIAELLV